MMISLRNIAKTYDIKGGVPVAALKHVNLDIARGEFVIITGRSGSGKTTLLNIAAGLTRPTQGQVLIDGVDLWSLNDREQSLLRNEKIGFIFQFPSLLPSLTTRENVVLPTVFSRNGNKEHGFERAGDLLRTVGLDEKLNAYPRQLSAGQQQRVVIARALVNKPEILLADEATSNLDEQTEDEIMQLLQQVHKTTGVTILMVAHSSQLVSYGTRAVTMGNGTVLN